MEINYSIPIHEIVKTLQSQLNADIKLIKNPRKLHAFAIHFQTKSTRKKPRILSSEQTTAKSNKGG